MVNDQLSFPVLPVAYLKKGKHCPLSPTEGLFSYPTLQVVLICLTASISATLAESQEELITGVSQIEELNLEEILPENENEISDQGEEMNLTESLVNIDRNGECIRQKNLCCFLTHNSFN